MTCNDCLRKDSEPGATGLRYYPELSDYPCLCDWCAEFRHLAKEEQEDLKYYNEVVIKARQNRTTLLRRSFFAPSDQ